ncbi:MAG: SLC13 family permease [Hyphomicrobiaceae bacterium]|nr:SLC13 family permease [Hyphomicrobiaceae bacterium]
MLDYFIANSDSFAMWLTFGVIGTALVYYAAEWAPIEVISLGAVVAILLIGTVFPDLNMSSATILAGFANPALLTILALLVMGQALIQTEAIGSLADQFARLMPKQPVIAVIVALVAAALISSIVNNTPVVVVFMPVLTSLLVRRKIAASKYMMPLSFVTILGGMTTLLGSSTNLLAAGVARSAGIESVTFFSFFVPGLAMAAIGILYALFVIPRFVPQNERDLPTTRGRAVQFITEIRLTPDHPLVGDSTVAGMFPKLTTLTVRAVNRGYQTFLPPFDDITLKSGDTLIIAATRDALTEALHSWKAFSTSSGILTTEDGDDTVLLYEALVPPGSRLVNNGVDQQGFLAQHGCLILGVERRSRMPRQRLADIRLEAGDVLLVAGSRSAFRRLRGLQDLIVMEWSGSEIRPHGMAIRAQLVFALTILVIATGLVPTEVASIAGAFAMIALGCLNVRQAARAIDRRIILLVGSSIAMAAALDASGGARAIAEVTTSVLGSAPPAVYMGGLFLVVAVLTNFLSNNATAVLFTPIAIAAAHQLGIDPLPLIATVILGANASFATPIGYQTNLLVMGAGHYRFRDFISMGTPLVILVWIVFCIVAPWYYGV